jgi:hypothetical protein
MNRVKEVIKRINKQGILLLLGIVFSIFSLWLGIYVTNNYLISLYKRTCLLNTKECVSFTYQLKDNSALIFSEPYGYWMFFNGKYLVVYGESIGGECPDNSTSAYAIDITSDKPKILGYVCVESVREVQKLFADREKLYMYIRPDNPDEYGVVNAINEFITRGIIHPDHNTTQFRHHISLFETWR